MANADKKEFDREIGKGKSFTVTDAKGIHKTLLERAQQACKEKSINDLAKRSGLSAIRVSRFIRGMSNINLKTAAKIAEALGLELVKNSSPK